MFEAEVVESEQALLEDQEIQMIAAAAIAESAWSFWHQVMKHGKDYFTDKTPFTALAQLTRQNRRSKTLVRNMSAVTAGSQNGCRVCIELIRDGVIGQVVQVIGLSYINAPQRPKWFFVKKYGGIICDIGSHQAEQFLTFTGASDAR